jgi:predicted MFS family arabinose efflux permease
MKVKRTFSLSMLLVLAATALIAATYGFVRLAYGLHLPAAQAELGFDAAAAGAISSGGSLAYCAGAALGFALAPRRPRTLVALAGITAGLGSAGIALSTSTALFAAAAVLSSTGAGLASPALVRIVQRAVRSDVADRAQTIVNAGTGPGLVAAGLLALALLPGWRVAWWVAAAIAVTAAAAVLALDRRDGARARPGARLPPRSWFLAHRRVVTAALLLGAGSAAVWNSGRALLADAGMPDELSVLAWVALGLGGLAVVPSAGAMSALGPRRTWVVTAGALAVATLALVASPGSLPLALACCLVFGWAYTAATGALIRWTALLEPSLAASGTALLFVLLVLGQAIGAAVAGAVVTAAGYGPAFLGAGLVAVVAGALGWTRRRAG